jgi:hypothetical protein
MIGWIVGFSFRSSPNSVIRASRHLKRARELSKHFREFRKFAHAAKDLRRLLPAALARGSYRRMPWRKIL